MCQELFEEEQARELKREQKRQKRKKKKNKTKSEQDSELETNKENCTVSIPHPIRHILYSQRNRW